MRFEKRYVISGKLYFESAFHIGSGSMGDLSDSGILKDPAGNPILPGSTLKGKFRSTVEKIAFSLKGKACLLNSALSGVNCVSDQDFRKTCIKDFKEEKRMPRRLEWLRKNTCEICLLFGSPLQAARIFFADGELQTWAKVTQVRDGVVIDRDSETAIDKLLFDYEVVPAGAVFGLKIEVVNPTEKDMAFIEAGLREWESGVMIGGHASRGLGRAKLQKVEISGVDFSNDEQRFSYFMTRQLVPDRRSEFANALQQAIIGGAGC